MSSNGSIVVAASVPGDIYSDLHAAKVIDDPLMEMNNMAQRWVSLENWTYSAIFNAKEIAPGSLVRKFTMFH